MRILFLSGWYPYPPDNGIKLRVLNLIKQLAKEYQLTLLSFASGPVEEDRLARMGEYCQSVHVVPYVEFEPTRLRAILGFLSSRPRSVVDTYNPRMAALVEEMRENGSFDVLIALELRTAPYACLMPDTPSILEDVELTVLWEQYSRQCSFTRRMRYGLTWYKTRRFMASLLRDFDACTVVSERERDLVREIVPRDYPVVVVPNGVDLAEYIGDFGAPRPDALIYPGSLTYDANFDAMRFFLREVFPLVREGRSQANLRITGRYDGVPIEQLSLGEGVELTGYIPDIRSAIAQSWVCIVPLLEGAGTRVKILEAMALGTPVVSTSKGAEGLSLTPDEDILIADEPQAFADTLVRLLGDPVLRGRLSENGRRTVSDRYGWDHIGRTLENLLRQVVAGTDGEERGDTYH